LKGTNVEEVIDVHIEFQENASDDSKHFRKDADAQALSTHDHNPLFLNKIRKEERYLYAVLNERQTCY
jgi:hypothetical protein